MLLVLIAGGVLVGASAAQLVAGQGWVGWPEFAAALLAGVILPLTLADKLLGRFAPTASAQTEIAWMSRTMLLWQVAWLAAGLGWLGQRPRPLVRLAWDGGVRVLRQVRVWSGSEVAPAGEVPEGPTAVVPDGPPETTEIRVDPPAEKPKPKPNPKPKPKPKPKPEPKPKPKPKPRSTEPVPVPEIVMPPAPPIRRPKPTVTPAPSATSRRPSRPRTPSPRARPPGFWSVDDGLTPIPPGGEQPRRLHGEVPEEVASLARNLAGGTRSDEDKLRRLHDWVAKHITYDVRMFRSGRIHDQDPSDVLRGRTAVCEGYSRLLAAMLQAVDVRADVVSGWARTTNETWADLVARSPRPNHAWNQVEIDGRIVSVDSTWDAGYVDGSRFVPHFRHRYFDPDAAVFARSHRRSPPEVTPADPNHHYFLLPKADQSELLSVAMKTAMRKPYFRGSRVHVWHSGATARNDGGTVQGLVMVQKDRDDISKGCQTLRFLRRRGKWEYKRMENCPAEGYLPREGYAPPSSYR